MFYLWSAAAVNGEVETTECKLESDAAAEKPEAAEEETGKEAADEKPENAGADVEMKDDESEKKDDVVKDDDAAKEDGTPAEDGPQVFVDRDQRILAKKPSVESTKLAEREKYWKPIKDDPYDFTGWTYLLQYVDHGESYPYKTNNANR